MSILGRPCAYSKMEKEDPEERNHRRAQFLIYKSLEQADSMAKRPRRASFLSVRISKLKIKIGKRLRKLRKSFSGVKVGLHKKVLIQLSSWKRLFHGGQAIVKLPPVFTC